MRKRGIRGMSKFSRFMKTNKVVKVNEKYAPTTSLLDDNGCPLEWEFRHITSKENDTLRESCTSEVQITGKPNLFRPKMDTAAYVAKMIVQSTVPLHSAGQNPQASRVRPSTWRRWAHAAANM